MAADEHARQARAKGLGVVFGLGLVAVWLTLVSMQVVRSDSYQEMARQNRQLYKRELAPRGLVSDRSGVVLADNIYQARLTVPRSRATPGDASLESLIDMLQLDREVVYRRIERSVEPERVTVVRHAKPELIARVEEHRPVLPDVQSHVEPRRIYRQGSLLAHVLGYVGEVRQSELDELTDSVPVLAYKPGDIIGRSGIESFAETLLRGRNGFKVVEVNASGHIVGELPEGHIPVLPGAQLYLTISQPLQARMEELLKDKVASGVVMEVATGDILAMASAPGFDPNEFTGGISQERWSELNSDPRTPMFNRSIKGTYPPASPYKIITAAAALEYKRVRPQDTFDPCFGSYRLGNRTFRCWEPRGHGTLDLEGAIAQSCDVYFYQLVQELTLDELAATARRFGLGSRTGLDLPGEASGLVPDIAYYDEKLGKGKWTTGYMLNNAIGQGELLTSPLQMVRAYAAIGGDGLLYRPNLVLARQNAFGVRDIRRVRRSSEPVCSPSTRKFLQRALHSVVSDDDGTGGLATVAGIEVSGKTGTAENSHGEDHAWFVAYAPSINPEVAVAVIVENSGHGGSIAAPIVGDLLEMYFQSKGVLGR